MNENLNVKFEYNVDEAVAFQLDFIRATREGASWRKREQWKFAISFVFIVACLLVFVSPDRSPAIVAGFVAFAVVVGAFVTVLFGRYYDHVVTTRLRRLMLEQLGEPGPYPCAIEIRTEGLWVAQSSVGLTFPWREAKNIEDTAEGITITFAGGRVLARSRGFTSQAHRDGFIAGVRNHVSSAAVAPPAA